LSDRQKHAAQGSLGGSPGALVEILFADGTRPHPKSRTTLKPGDRLIMRYSGGGGYGDPAKRGKAAVADDLREGLISDVGARNYAQ
jgi:N-methylhydantoinase B